MKRFGLLVALLVATGCAEPPIGDLGPEELIVEGPNGHEMTPALERLLAPVTETVVQLEETTEVAIAEVDMPVVESALSELVLPPGSRADVALFTELGLDRDDVALRLDAQSLERLIIGSEAVICGTVTATVTALAHDGVRSFAYTEVTVEPTYLDLMDVVDVPTSFRFWGGSVDGVRYYRSTAPAGVTRGESACAFVDVHEDGTAWLSGVGSYRPLIEGRLRVGQIELSFDAFDAHVSNIQNDRGAR